MTTLITRASKGSPLTNAEADANWNALNAGKIETSLLAVALGVATLDASGYLLAAQISPTFNAATVTTNANLTGPITSVGNATSINSQTGTGSTFAMSVSPTFTGTPAAPTAAVDTNTTQLATTAFVAGQASATNPLMNGSVAVGTSLRYAREDHGHASDTSRAPTASPTFTGTATFNIISAAGQINSTLATGTAPLVIASTTQVANLNVSLLQGNTWAAPGPIGATTQSSAQFTTVAASDILATGSLTCYSRIVAMSVAGDSSSAILAAPSATSTIPLIGTTQRGSRVYMESTTNCTVAAYGNESRVSTAAGVYTMPLGVNFMVSDGVQGAGSTYTEQDGFRCSNLTGAATNIGFRSMLTSGANKWNAYFDGTAQNYFAGLTGFGVSVPTYPIDVISATADYIGIQIRGGSGTDVGGVRFASYAGVVQGRILGGPSGYISFATGNPLVTQVQVVHLASVVNSLTLTGAIAGGDPIVGTLGPSGDIGLKLTCKGTGKVTITSHSGVQTQFRVRGDNVAVNYLDVFGTTTGNGPIIRAEGVDSNIRVNLYSKGTESVRIGTNQGAQVAADFTHVASAVNYPSICGAISGSGPIIQAAGSDPDIPLLLSSKGTGAVGLYTGAATLLQVSVIDVAGANRYVTLAGSNSGNPTIGVSGGSLALSAAVIGASTIACTAGTGTGQPVMIGTLHVDTTAVGNVGAGTDDLMTYSLPANSLSANKKGVRITVWGRCANNANAKTVSLLFGATSISIPTRTSVDHAWRVVCTVIRTGSGAQLLSAEVHGSTVNSTTVSDNGVSESTPAETDTAAITIKCTAVGVADNDIVQKGLHVEFIN